MAHHMSMVPSQTMRLEQRLTPQLIQSMEILQLPLLALEARVRSELEANPVLEDAELRDEPMPAATDATDATVDAEKPAASPEAESFDRLDRMSREYDFDPADQPYARPAAASGERDAKMDAMANSAAPGPSLQEYLERQWAMMDLSPEVRHAGLTVLNWMNPDGYLRTRAEQDSRDDGKTNGSLPLIIRRDTASLEKLDDEIARSVTPPLDAGVLEEAIARVQTLEPRGVGARDLTESLLIQLDALPEHHPLAETLVENHLDDMARNRLPNIARVTGHSIEEIKEALSVIARLHHHPGSLISPEQVPPIVPDIIVDFAEDTDGYTVRLARGQWQGLRISPHYRLMLEQGAGGDGEAKSFLRKNLEAAKALIDAIHYRRDRLLQIAKIVVERQREFFDDGPRHLKVLLMRDIAAELGCDPSTISRTVDQKYIQSPRGIDPLRMFFTGGTETAAGEVVSWDAVKQKVREIIDEEDKTNPLSDDEIVKHLIAAGQVNISRRTVAKYRAQLNIPAARERKQF